VDWGSELLQRLQKVRANCKTRNQLYVYPLALRDLEASGAYRTLHSDSLCSRKMVCRRETVPHPLHDVRAQKSDRG